MKYKSASSVMNRDKLFMKNLLILLSVLLLLPLSVFAQRTDLHFVSMSENLEEVKYWSSSPAVFHFTNNGPGKIALLKAENNPNVKVVLPKGFIMPGETDSIVIYLYPKTVGKYDEKVKVYPSDINGYFSLRVKGEITSIDACPGSEVQNKEKEILVIDAVTKKPIEKVKVNLYIDSRNKVSGTTGREGFFETDMKAGLYQSMISHDGYKQHNEMIYVNQYAKRIVIELVPIEKPIEEETAEIIPEETYPDTLVYSEIDIPEITDETLEADTDLPENADVIFPEDTVGLLPVKDFKYNNVVFLIDVSTSMRVPSRMPLLKTSVTSLFDVLREEDKVSLITYATEQTVIFTGMSGDNRDSMKLAVDTLVPYGRTYGVKGLKKAYEIAKENYIPGGNNQVIVATDGEFNSKEFSNIELMRMINAFAKEGIILTIVGFGDDKQAMRRMGRMAVAGKGSYIHISTRRDINELLIEEIKKQSRRS